MNREIKFRLWDKHKKEFLKYDCWFPHTNFKEFTCFDRNFITEDEGITIQQFTGLVDRNGTEIYEGDLVKTGYGEFMGCTGEVVFDYGAFMLMGETGGMFSDTYDSCRHGTVVGNIFETHD